MKVGILRFDKHPSLKMNAIAYISHYHNIDFFYFQPEDVDFERKIINGRFYIDDKWEYRETEFPDIIDNAPSIAKYQDFYTEMLKHVPMICYRIGNKQKVQDLLEKDGQYKNILIATEEVVDFSSFDNFMQKYSQVILKPIGRNMGRDIYKVSQNGASFIVETDHERLDFENKQELEKWFKNKEFSNFVQQEYVQSLTYNGLPFDIRAHVRRGKDRKWNTVKVYPRIGIHQNVTSNISQGGAISKLVSFLKNNYENYQEIQDNLNKFAREFPPYFQKFYSYELDALGIDLGLDEKGNIKLFEVNTYPGSNFLDIEDSIVRVQYYKSLGKK